jgi:hypothetical protein
VGETSHAVVQEAKEGRRLGLGGGVERQQATIVGTDGAVTDGPVPETKAARAMRAAQFNASARDGTSMIANPRRPRTPDDRVVARRRSGR